MPRPGTGRLGTLEALRGIAALLVVLYHLQDISTARTGIIPFGGIFGSGDHGVDLFFVLSGFIVMTTHAGDIGSPVRLLPYLYKRTCRIFPGVWIMTSLAAILYACHFGSAGKMAKLEPWNIAASALLLPQNGPALVNVTWTLKYEIFFYAVFALMIAGRRVGAILWLVWQSAVLLGSLGLLHVADTVAGYYLRPVCLEFGIGMFCAWLILQQGTHMKAGWISVCLLAAGITGFAGGLLYEALWIPHGLQSARLLVFGGSSGAIVLGLSRLERDGLLRAPAFLTALGGMSYAVYLVHYSVITLAITALTRVGWIPLDNAALLGCALLGVAAGAGFHHLIDRPIQIRLKRLGQYLFQGRASSTPGSFPSAMLAMPHAGRAEW